MWRDLCWDSNPSLRITVLWLIGQLPLKISKGQKWFDMWKCQLDLFLNQHKVWRCGGRLNKADISYSSKHPILHSKQHHLATLTTDYTHERTMHGAVKETLTEIQLKYQVVRWRQFVRKIIDRYMTCCKVKDLNYCAVPPPPLPEFRVQWINSGSEVRQTSSPAQRMVLYYR